MAKVNVKTLSEDELVERTVKLERALEEAQKVYDAAKNKLSIQRELLRKVQLEREARGPQDLAAMLTTYLPSGENTVGHKWLQDKCWKGDWRDTGFGRGLGWWTHTNQYSLGVRIPDAKFTDAQLADLEKIIQGVMPAVKAGAYDGGDLKLMSKGSSVALKDLKVLDISDAGCNEYSNWQLGLMPTGEWVIFDSYKTKYNSGRARLTGTLGECVREIRQYLNASSREDQDD